MPILDKIKTNAVTKRCCIDVANNTSYYYLFVIPYIKKGIEINWNSWLVV